MVHRMEGGYQRDFFTPKQFVHIWSGGKNCPRTKYLSWPCIPSLAVILHIAQTQQSSPLTKTCSEWQVGLEWNIVPFLRLIPQNTETVCPENETLSRNSQKPLTKTDRSIMLTGAQDISHSRSKMHRPTSSPRKHRRSQTESSRHADSTFWQMGIDMTKGSENEVEWGDVDHSVSCPTRLAKDACRVWYHLTWQHSVEMHLRVDQAWWHWYQAVKTAIVTLGTQPFIVSDIVEDPTWRLYFMMILFLMNCKRVRESRWTCSITNSLSASRW